MARYFIAPRAEYWDEPPLLGATITVYEPDESPAKTGLVDQHGLPIYRASDRIPMGFDTTPAFMATKSKPDSGLGAKLHGRKTDTVKRRKT